MSASPRWSEIGALASAGTVAATILCCLPFATGVIGASLAAAGARFEPYQPYLALLSLTLLGYAFVQAYRRTPVCATDVCAASKIVRRRRIVLWISAAMVVALLTAQWWANWVIYWTL